MLDIKRIREDFENVKKAILGQPYADQIAYKDNDSLF